MSEFVTPADVLEKPWVVYELPYFHDEWEDWNKRLPKNLNFVHHIGSRAYWETLLWSEDGRFMNLHSHNFAPFGVQFEEDEYREAFAVAKKLAKDHRVHHVRYDLEGSVEETWRNTAFRHIHGHSMHKIPPDQLATEYIEVNGEYWHVREFYEAQLAQNSENS